MASDKELNDFLKSVDKRAFKRVVYAVRDEDAAVDIVQDTMIRLAEKYADRPAAELPLLQPTSEARCRHERMIQDLVNMLASSLHFSGLFARVNCWYGNMTPARYSATTTLLP